MLEITLIREIKINIIINKYHDDKYLLTHIILIASVYSKKILIILKQHQKYIRN